MAKREAKTNIKEKNKKSFSKDFKAELKKVVWPTPKQLVNNTVAVITIVLITAVIVFALDLTFEALNKYGVEKVKELITTTEVTPAGNTSNSEALDIQKNENDETKENTENVENNTETNSQ